MSDNDERKTALNGLPLGLLRWFICGEPLATKQYDQNRLGKTLALPIFCSDAISSVAYGPQQILLALTMAGLWVPALWLSWWWRILHCI